MPDREPNCPLCGDLGFVITEKKCGISGAKRCTCQDAAAPKLRVDRANIPDLYRESTLDNFDTSVSHEMKQVLLQCVGFVSKFPNGPYPGLLLIGEPGTGKTHLAIGVLKRLLSAGHHGLFSDYQTLLNNIRAGYDPGSNHSDEDTYRTALDTEVLLLDDLGAHRVTDWVQDTVTSIVTHRCNNRKALIATTNLPDADAGSAVTQKGTLGIEYRRTLKDHVGERARSRLFEMCTVIRINHCEDFRTRRAKYRIHG